MEIAIPLNTILDRVDYSSFEGELGVHRLMGVASLDEARRGDITFVASSKHIAALEKSKASLVILDEETDAKPKSGQLFLRVKKPSIEIAKVCELIARSMWTPPAPGIHRLANISSRAQVSREATVGAFVTVADGAHIGPGCVIESGCHVGEDCQLAEGCWLGANVVLERDTKLGCRVRVHAGSVLGADGFGYEFLNGKHVKIPQVGSVTIGDDVEIGSNTTIDRGRFGPTRIGEGTKIDNLVQIGHNADIGKHCIICAQVGLAGSTTLEDYVVMGGRAGAAGHLTIGAAAQLSGECVAYSDLEGDAKYGGAPAVSLVAYQRMIVLQRKLPDLFKRLNRLESQLSED